MLSTILDNLHSVFRINPFRKCILPFYGDVSAGLCSEKALRCVVDVSGSHADRSFSGYLSVIEFYYTSSLLSLVTLLLFILHTMCYNHWMKCYYYFEQISFRLIKNKKNKSVFLFDLFFLHFYPFLYVGLSFSSISFSFYPNFFF